MDKTFSVTQIIEPAWKRNNKFVEHCAFSQFGCVFGDLISDSAGTWLSVMSVDMATMSLSDINCQALGAIPVLEPNKWILRQLRVAFSQEPKRRASAVTKTEVSLYSILVSA